LKITSGDEVECCVKPEQKDSNSSSHMETIILESFSKFFNFNFGFVLDYFDMQMKMPSEWGYSQGWQRKV